MQVLAAHQDEVKTHIGHAEAQRPLDGQVVKKNCDKIISKIELESMRQHILIDNLFAAYATLITMPQQARQVPQEGV